MLVNDTTCNQMIRKNISLYEKDLKKIECIVKKYDGNLSAAMREIIGFSDYVLRKFGSFEEAKKVEKRIKGVCLPTSMLNWLLAHSGGCLPDDDAIESLEEIQIIDSLSVLVDIASTGFAVDIDVVADDERNPSEATLVLTGEKMQARFLAKLLACFLAEHKGLVVTEVSRKAVSTSVKLKREGTMGSEVYYQLMRDRLIEHFGERHVMMQEILDKPKFWNSMVNATTEWGDVQRYKYPKLFE